MFIVNFLLKILCYNFYFQIYKYFPKNEFQKSNYRVKRKTKKHNNIHYNLLNLYQKQIDQITKTFPLISSI